MWRSLFLALGIMLAILGIECLLIDSASLHAASTTAQSATRTFTPSEWQTWSFIGAGALTILYAITLRRGGDPAPE